MNYYQVVLEGNNFRIKFDGKDQLMGFYTTRFIKANTPEEAELFAVETIKSDEWLQEAITNTEEHPEPRIYLEEMYEIKKNEMASPYGYGWFPMSDKK